MTNVPAEHNPEEQRKPVSRRDFLRVGGTAAAVGTAGLLAGPLLLKPLNAAADSESGIRYAMVIDLQRCFGCRACVQACKVENNTPGGISWMYLFRFEEGSYPNVTAGYMSRPCMHCGNPPCVKVCPTGARFKREDGLVLTDYARCIGCRYCQVSCPYGVNYFNWKKPDKNYYLDWEGETPPYKNPDHDKEYGGKIVSGGGHYVGVMEKCTFCVHRLAKGLEPACVANCPVRVYHFGDINDPNSKVSKLLGEKRWFRLLEELDTQPSVFYVGNPPASSIAKLIESDRLDLELNTTKLEVRQ